jgi:hypothetical protein
MDAQTIASPQQTQLLEILTTLSYRSSDLSDYLNDIAIAVSQLISSDWSVVTLCEGDAGKVVGSSQALSQDITYQMHGTLADVVVRTAHPVILEDVRLHPHQPQPPQGYLSYFGMPLRTMQGEIVGTVCSFNYDPRDYTDEQIRTVRLLAERAAVAIDNYRLYQQQQHFNQRLAEEVALRTADLQAAQAQLVQQEQLAAIGEFAAMIVHELKNPMTTVLLGLERFHKTAATAADQLRAELALSEVQRLKRLLSEILLYAKPQILQRTVINLNQFIPAVIQPLLPQVNCPIEFTPSQGDLRVWGDRDKLQQALTNVIENGCEATEKDVRIQVSMQSDRAHIQIHNSGAQIPPDCLARLTEPFYSTKPSGTGLGLAIVKRIIEAHDGQITIASEAPSGTTVSLILPIRQAEF